MSGLSSALALAALGFTVLVLLFLLWRQIHQRNTLMRWLQNPQHVEIPDGVGAWRAVFSQLQRLRKDELKIRSTLGGNLDRFHQAAQALPDGVILLDADSHIEWLNVAACEHFGLDAGRDIGTLVVQLIRHTEFNEMFRDFKSGKDAGPLVIKMGANESRRVLSLMLLEFSDSGVMLLSRDISEIARAETMRRDFIANVSHELRTPLTVISGFLEQMTAAPLPDSSSGGALALMAEQAQRMNRLVDDLLRLSRLENTSEPPRDDDIDVTALCESLLAEARMLSAGRHCIEAGYLCECHIRGSSDEIRSAFSNLVTNAVRYTPAGGTITLSFEGQGAQLAFAVTDSGIGIPAEHIPRLTERFYRVDKGRSAETGGTGLGLAIVKHVLARHQGSLSIRSQVGKGSTFTAYLPGERKIQTKD